jgi:hypothetical protein
VSKTKIIIAVVLGAFWLAITITALWGWNSAHKQVAELEAKLDTLAREVKHATILKSVSGQMETIAYEQKAISDMEREKAVLQTRKAQEAESQALASEKKALEASYEAKRERAKALILKDSAEHERIIADQQRVQAELSKRKADTLSYILLGRSVGSNAIMQYQTGNEEVAQLLAYAAYMFTSRYTKDKNTDLYHPAIFQALMYASNSKHTWAVHKGALRAIDFMAGSNTVLTSVSNYGEIMRHELKGNNLNSEMVLSNSSYDFRDVYMDDKGGIYAISRSGHFVVIPDKYHEQKTLKIEGVKHPSKLVSLGKDTIVVVGENGVAFIDAHQFLQIGVLNFDYNITAVNRALGFPLFFDDRGSMHEVHSLTKVTTEKTPVNGYITAYARSNHKKMDAYGTREGTIWVVDSNKNVRKLVGHRSRISRIKINGDRLYSSSYDGKMYLWMLNNEKLEPMELFSANGWILYFTTDESKNSIWAGDQKGNLTDALISIPKMVTIIKNGLKRNLSREEWNSYIGVNIPYETFINGKEGGK